MKLCQTNKQNFHQYFSKNYLHLTTNVTTWFFKIMAHIKFQGMKESSCGSSQITIFLLVFIKTKKRTENYRMVMLPHISLFSAVDGQRKFLFLYNVTYNIQTEYATITRKKTMLCNTYHQMKRKSICFSTVLPNGTPITFWKTQTT